MRKNLDRIVFLSLHMLFDGKIMFFQKSEVYDRNLYMNFIFITLRDRQIDWFFSHTDWGTRACHKDWDALPVPPIEWLFHVMSYRHWLEYFVYALVLPTAAAWWTRVEEAMSSWKLSRSSKKIIKRFEKKWHARCIKHPEIEQRNFVYSVKSWSFPFSLCLHNYQSDGNFHVLLKSFNRRTTIYIKLATKIRGIVNTVFHGILLHVFVWHIWNSYAYDSNLMEDRSVWFMLKWARFLFIFRSSFVVLKTKCLCASLLWSKL